MDMDAPFIVPGCGGINITHLPLSDPCCYNATCIAYKEGYAASQAQISWASQGLYAHYVTWFWCALFLVFALLALWRFVSDFQQSHLSTMSKKGPSLGEEILAIVRSIHYRRLSGRLGSCLGLPSCGLSLIILVCVLFAVLLVFVPRPYYRLHRGFGSPPLGVRSGMAATGAIPIILAMSGKVNLVTALTGISYERLNVLHRWAGWIMLFLSIVHTVPFLIIDGKRSDGGAKLLDYQFYKHGSFEYTGIAPFAVLIFLSTFSIPFIRHRLYEVFCHTHVWAAIAFLGTMFWHVQNEMDSRNYMLASVAILVSNWILRALTKTSLLEFWHTGVLRKRSGAARLQVVDGNMTKLIIQARMNWTPAQHVFLRFPKLNPFDNHPFTIASMCNEVFSPDDGQSHDVDKYNELKFLVRPRSGLTKKLQHQDLSELTVLIDGPYGGIKRPVHLLYDHAILVAGGGGISAALPWLEHLTGMIAGNIECRISHITLLWCVRSKSCISWVRPELDGVQALAGRVKIEVQIFVTDEKNDVEKNVVTEDIIVLPNMIHGIESTKSWHIKQERPYLPTCIDSLITHDRTMVFECGPESMKIDVSNAVARAQRKVLHGNAQVIELYTETFGW